MFLFKSLSLNLFHKHRWMDSFHYCLKCAKKSPWGSGKSKEQHPKQHSPLLLGTVSLRGINTDGFAPPGISESAEIHEGHKTRASERLLLWLWWCPFLRCCLGNWGCVYSEILLYIYCVLNAVGHIRKFVAKMLHEAQCYQENCIIKFTSWTSLVIQWIKLQVPVQGTQVPSLVWEDPTCLGATQPVCQSYWALGCNYWAHEPRATCLATREATALRSLSLPQLEKAQVQQWRPSAAKKQSQTLKNWSL